MRTSIDPQHRSASLMEGRRNAETIDAPLARRIVVGTAGWSIPKDVAGEFPAEGSTLTRYAARFPGVEINSTFYRSHRPSTYARWRESVPEDFRFSVKVPKVISHEKGLVDVEPDLRAFLDETAALGEQRGPLLLQLPPKLAFEEPTALDFLRLFRELFHGSAVIEPRHVSWFTAEVDALLVAFEIARVGTDPPRAEGGESPGGYCGLTYLRLHGAPRVYFSAYDASKLDEAAEVLLSASGPGWCIFDNTASGAAARNALDTVRLLGVGDSNAWPLGRRATSQSSVPPSVPHARFREWRGNSQ